MVNMPEESFPAFTEIIQTRFPFRGCKEAFFLARIWSTGFYSFPTPEESASYSPL
jgi:hypothetical protein